MKDLWGVYLQENLKNGTLAKEKCKGNDPFTEQVNDCSHAMFKLGFPHTALATNSAGKCVECNKYGRA